MSENAEFFLFAAIFGCLGALLSIGHNLKRVADRLDSSKRPPTSAPGTSDRPDLATWVYCAIWAGSVGLVVEQIAYPSTELFWLSWFFVAVAGASL